jgi:tetratricopeptide (TPR) repeat protein
VAKGKRSRPSNPPDAAPTLPLTPKPAPRRRLYQLLGLLGVVACVAIAWWSYEARRLPLPDVPTIDFAGVDPEVVNAIRTARSQVLEDRQSGDTWGRYGMTLQAHSYIVEAAICYGAAEQLDSNNPYWPYLHGTILQDGGDPVAALPLLSRAADLTEPTAPPRMLLADLLLELERLDEAAAEYQKGIDSDRNAAHAQLGLGQIAMARQQYKEALVHLQAVADNPFAQKRSCVLRITAYERLGQRESAQVERDKLAKMPTDDDPPWPDRGKEVMRSFQVGLRARLQRGPALLRQDPPQIKEAVAVMREATQLYPDSHLAWASLARMLAIDNDFAGADKAIHQAIDLAKTHPDHWIYLGILNQSQRQYRTAIDAFRQAVSLRSSDATAHFYIGECLEELDDRTGAANAYRAALHHRPDMQQARTRLAKLESKK